MRTRRLRGGISAEVRALRLDDGDMVVLRQWPASTAGKRGAWVDDEVAVLDALAATEVPAPRAIASDRDEGRVLMTRLPGRMDIAPRDLDRWLLQLARSLPPIHAVPFGAGFLAHQDFQHFNVLWWRGRLTGVVDWAWASAGHPDDDVGHCMLNLVLRFDADVAERFRTMYEAEAGRVTDAAVLASRLGNYNPGWKASLPRQAIGVQLDLDGMDARHADLLERTVRRAG